MCWLLFYRTTITLHGALLTTYAVVEPNNNREKVPVPVAPIKIKSIFFSYAKATILAFGFPSSTTVL